MVRVPDCDSGCCGFESRHPPHQGVVQMVRTLALDARGRWFESSFPDIMPLVWDHGASESLARGNLQYIGEDAPWCVNQAHGLVQLKRSGSTPEVGKFTAVKGSMTTPSWYWKTHSVQSHRTRHGRIVGMEAKGSWSLRHVWRMFTEIPVGTADGCKCKSCRPPTMRGKLSDRLLVSYARDTGFDSQTRNSWYYYKKSRASLLRFFSFEELFFSSSSSFLTASHVYIWLGSKSVFSSLFISVSGYSLGFLSLK